MEELKATVAEMERTALKAGINLVEVSQVVDPLLLLLMVSSSLYVSHMFVTRVLSSLVFRVVLL